MKHRNKNTIMFKLTYNDIIAATLLSNNLIKLEPGVKDNFDSR